MARIWHRRCEYIWLHHKGSGNVRSPPLSEILSLLRGSGGDCWVCLLWRCVSPFLINVLIFGIMWIFCYPTFHPVALAPGMTCLLNQWLYSSCKMVSVFLISAPGDSSTQGIGETLVKSREGIQKVECCYQGSWRHSNHSWDSVQCLFLGPILHPRVREGCKGQA